MHVCIDIRVYNYTLYMFYRYLYWSSKTEAKIYCMKMNGESLNTNTTDSDSVLIRQYSLPRNTSATVIGLSLNVSSSGALQLYWGVRVSGGSMSR